MEFNVVRQIKSHWDKIIGLSDNETNEEFADATSEHSVRTSDFLNGLNFDLIMPEVVIRRSGMAGSESRSIPPAASFAGDPRELAWLAGRVVSVCPDGQSSHLPHY